MKDREIREIKQRAKAKMFTYLANKLDLESGDLSPQDELLLDELMERYINNNKEG